MKKMLILLTIITFSLSIAQITNGRLKGRVADESETGKESATVSFEHLGFIGRNILSGQR